MATPLIEAGDCTVSGNNTATTSWAVSHPNASAGDLLIWNLGWDDSTSVTSITAPSGPNGETLTSIAGPVASSNTDVRAQAWYTVATGSWTAGTRTFTPSASESWSATVIRVPATEFHANTPIVTSATRASTASSAAVLSPAFTAAAADVGGRLVWLGVANADSLDATAPTGWTARQRQDLGAVAHGIATRDAAVTASESIAGGDSWVIAGDTWCSIAYIVRESVPASVSVSGQSTTAQTHYSVQELTGGTAWDSPTTAWDGGATLWDTRDTTAAPGGVGGTSAVTSPSATGEAIVSATGVSITASAGSAAFESAAYAYPTGQQAQSAVNSTVQSVGALSGQVLATSFVSTAPMYAQATTWDIRSLQLAQASWDLGETGWDAPLDAQSGSAEIGTVPLFLGAPLGLGVVPVLLYGETAGVAAHTAVGDVIAVFSAKASPVGVSVNSARGSVITEADANAVVTGQLTQSALRSNPAVSVGVLAGPQGINSAYGEVIFEASTEAFPTGQSSQASIGIVTVSVGRAAAGKIAYTSQGAVRTSVAVAVVGRSAQARVGAARAQSGTTWDDNTTEWDDGATHWDRRVAATDGVVANAQVGTVAVVAQFDPLPIYYEDVRATLVYVGSRQVVSVFRGNNLLWGEAASVEVNALGVSASSASTTAQAVGHASLIATGQVGQSGRGIAVATGDAIRAVTGSSAQTTIGSVLIGGNRAVYPAGVAAQSQQGVASLRWDYSIDVSGLSGTSDIGTATTTAGTRVTATGQVGQSARGTSTAVGNATAAVSGRLANARLGTATVRYAGNAQATGQTATTDIGTATVAVGTRVDATGQSAETQLGSVTAETGGRIVSVGASAQSGRGFVSLIYSGSIVVSGREVLARVGQVSVRAEFSATTAADGAAAQSAVGTATARGGRNVNATGVEASTGFGSVTTTLGTSAFPEGVEADGSLGSLGFIYTGRVDVLGVFATGRVGRFAVPMLEDSRVYSSTIDYRVRSSTTTLRVY